jgi:2-polyprenyl-6-methoxyphenol hydroxylase-like FAD-dependent oxidoreductase
MQVSSNTPSSTFEQDRGRHALVIGGSMAGLLAARVLVDYFDQVTILDRDTFPETPDHRKGVPQSQHTHGLLPKGHVIIRQMFPGIMDELRAAGALAVRGVVPIVMVSQFGKLPAQRLDSEFIAFSRYLLEWHLRHRVSMYPGIHLQAHTEVNGLLTTPDRTRVIGVQTRVRGTAGHTDTMTADLVVDASGRSSQAHQWLTTLGYGAPPQEIVHSHIGYASRFYSKPADVPAEWQGLIVSSRPPHNPRAGLIAPVENGRWHVTLAGIGGHYPQLDEESFLQWARELADPSIYEALRVAKPLTPIRGYRTPENCLRHFERLQRWPSGFIVTGDAACAFNPIYGQGMTVCAMDAQLLAECLKEQQQCSRADFERRFQQRLAQTVATPWMLALRGDLRWPGVTLSGTRLPLRFCLVHRYLDFVLRCAVEDPVVAQAYAGVTSMFAPLQSLTKPRILMRLLSNTFKRMVRGGAETAQQPALSPEALAFLRAQPAVLQEHSKGL